MLASRCCSRFFSVPTVVLMAALWLAIAPPASADPDWGSLPYTLFSTMQAVDGNGFKTWAVPPNGGEPGYKLRGVVLNNPGDMLDSTANYIYPALGTMGQIGGQWQVYIQFIDDPSTTADDNDFGGSALWMGQNYGNQYSHHPEGKGSNYAEAAAWNYTNDAWNAEVARVSLAGTLQAGDLIEVHARGGLFYGGKFNVNEEHDNASELDFDIIRLDHGVIPDPTPISLDLIKNAADNSFKFSQDRTLSTNPEHYQATLVRLENVAIQSGTWAPGQTLVVADATNPTYTFNMLLGIDSAFSTVAAPSGAFDVVGIFDQESPGSGPYTLGYRLWVMDAGQFGSMEAVPEPAGIVLLVTGAALSAAFLQRKRTTWKRPAAN